MTNVSALRASRKAIGLSQEALARKARCSTSTIRLAERGWQPSPKMAARIARALARSCDDVFPPGENDELDHEAQRIADDEIIGRIEEERRQWG